MTFFLKTNNVKARSKSINPLLQIHRQHRMNGHVPGHSFQTKIMTCLSSSFGMSLFRPYHQFIVQLIKMSCRNGDYVHVPEPGTMTI